MHSGLNNLEGIIEEIKKNEAVEAIYLFGSHAKSRAKPYSDIDLCVITERNVSKDMKEEILSNSYRKIDISIFWDIPLNIRFRVIKEKQIIIPKKTN